MSISSAYLGRTAMAASGLIFLLALLAPQARAQGIALQFTQISDAQDIVDIRNAGDAGGRLFLVEQAGRVLILADGQPLAEPFLDIRDRVKSGGEQGLLSIAFAPDYGSSGYFYAWYTNEAGDTVLSRFRVGADPDVASAASETVLMQVQQPFSNHNGGRLQFGPDGMLYLGLGDGGSANDPQGNGQSGSTLLGKLIRIDVDPAHGTFAIPPDNPFAASGDGFGDAIWALGLRNPWRISFDRKTGDLYIADVGQGGREEINFQPASSAGGENYGWQIMEGTACVQMGCDMEGLTLPVAEYEHNLGCSVTGGEVYRGNAYPALEGLYLFGDFCSGRVWSLRRIEGEWTMSELADTDFAITTFGLGEDDSVYVSDRNSGIYLISDGPVVEESFQITAGLNDAWFNPATDGQGFFIVVFEDAGIVFLSWFTFDVERPPQNVMAMLGEPGHRWLTAQGPFNGDTAELDVFVTSGGVFDSGMPAPETVQDGTMTIEWSGCNAGLVSYDIPSLGLQGEIPIERVALDNVPLCQQLQ